MKNKTTKDFFVVKMSVRHLHKTPQRNYFFVVFLAFLAGAFFLAAIDDSPSCVRSPVFRVSCRYRPRDTGRGSG